MTIIHSDSERKMLRLLKRLHLQVEVGAVGAVRMFSHCEWRQVSSLAWVDRSRSDLQISIRIFKDLKDFFQDL